MWIMALRLRWHGWQVAASSSQTAQSTLEMLGYRHVGCAAEIETNTGAKTQQLKTVLQGALAKVIYFIYLVYSVPIISYCYMTWSASVSCACGRCF